MKTIFKLSYKSLWHRRETVVLTTMSLALSIFLTLSVERLRLAAQEGFTQTISQADLIVGARTGPTNLVLATIFNRGVFANNIKRQTYEKWKNHAAVDWSIPLVLGDGHRGFRVVGTTTDFFKHYRYQGQKALELRQGEWSDGALTVVAGAEVARKLQYSLGQSIVLEHGVTREVGMLRHDDQPFRLVGILNSTGTIIDQSLFVSMESLEHLHHEDAQPESDHHDGEDHKEDHKEDQADLHRGEELTGFILRLKNRVDVLRLQREINNETLEPLTAVIPSVVVNDLWQMLGTVENALRVLGGCILVVSLLSMISILMATLNERRREMAILRAIGAGPRQLASLLVIESVLMTLVAVILGALMQVLVVVALRDWLQTQYGLFLTTLVWTQTEILYALIVMLLGALVGLWPALKVYRNTLKDGLIPS